IINIVLALGMFALIVLVCAGGRFSKVMEALIGVFFLTTVVAGSVYKLKLWFKYRHDPERREEETYSNQFYSAARGLVKGARPRRDRDDESNKRNDKGDPQARRD